MSALRQNRARDPPDSKRDSAMQIRDWIWSNGAVVCDKWLKHKRCTRNDCTHLHKDPRPGDIVPLCYDHFRSKDSCSEGPQCPFSHDRNSAPDRIAHGEYSRSSQSNSSPGLGESGDASKAVRPKEPKTLPPSRKFRPQGTYMPPGKRAVAEVVQREPKARAPTNSSPKVRSGPTVSTAFVPPPPDSCYIPNRRNDITNGNRGPPDPPYKGYQQNPTARPPQPANPGIKTEKPSDPLLVETQRTRPSLGFVKTLEDIPPVSDRRLPNKLRHSKSLGDNLIQGNVSSPERHPESFNTPEDVPHAESLKTPEVTPAKPHPESVKILEEVTPPQLHPDTTKIPADYAAPKRHSSNSPQLPNSSSDRNPEPVIEHLNIFNNPQLADDSSSSAGGVMLDESLVTPTDSKDDSSMPIVKLPESLELEGSKNPALEDGSRAGSSCSTPVARSTSASIDNEAFYHQFHDINTLLDEPPGAPGGESTAESEFSTLVCSLKAGQNSKEYSNTESQRTTAKLVTPPVPSRTPLPRPRALRDAERCIPEWELPRCFNCFQERHYPNPWESHCRQQNCPDTYRMSPQREELREKLGVINRLWTEFVLSHDFPYYIKVKHRAFQRIWQPYTSEVSGKFVSPVPVSVLAEARATPDASSSAISIVVRREEPPRAEPNVDSSAISSVVQHKEPPQAASDAGPSVVTTVIRYQEPPQAAPDAGSSVVTSVIQYKEPQRIYSDQAIQTEGLSYIDRGVQTEPRYISRDSHSQTDKPCGVSLGSNLNVLTSYLGVAPQPKNDTPRSGKDQGVQTDPLRDQPRDQPREKKERYKLSENTESVTDVVVTSKNLDHCWDCGKTHLRFQPCEAPQQSNSKEQDWEQSKWEEQLKMLAPLPKNNGLQKQNPKQRARKPNKVLTMARSRLVDSDTTVYRIENGEKEIIFDRTDLTLLAPLDREAKRGVVGGSDDESNHNRRPYVKNNSPLARCPNEILEAILTYAADECPSGRKTKVRDIIAGHDFGVDDGVVDNIRKAKNLSGAVKSCRQLRQVAQQVIYKVVSIDKYKALRRFALSLTADPELGKMVQVFRVNLCQTTQSYRNRGLFRYQMENRNVASNTDFASLFVRVVESCPSLQVLSVKMYGSILGFGAVRGKFTKMREICISDPVSSGQVLNQMWNHLTDFPQLQKFKIVHSDINDSVDFEPLEIPYHMADKALDFTFKNLGTLTLENAPEVSDNLLFYIVRRLTALNKLAIVNCKLVSSGGLAQALGEIPGRLSTLVFWVWLDHNGCPNARETQSTRYHLCSAINDYGETLSVLNMKPYKLCEDMWRGSKFKRLHRCNIDMMQFCHCRNGDNSRDESSFEAAYKVAREEERLPHLDESSAIFHLHTPGISFR